jgi:hypothetical protein
MLSCKGLTIFNKVIIIMRRQLMKFWKHLIFALFLTALGLAGCNGQPVQTQPQPDPVPQTETYTDEHGFFTVDYPAGWVVKPYLFSDEAPFPHVALASHQEIIDLSMAEQRLPENQIGVGIMVLPRDMFAEAGITAETPLDEAARLVLMGMVDDQELMAEMLAEATFESIALTNGTPAIYSTAQAPNEVYAVTLAELDDGLYLFTSQILALDYSNAELEAQVEAIVNSFKLTGSADEVADFIVAQMGTMEEMGEGVAPPTVTFTATEYAYDGLESIPGGLTRIELVNTGEQEHGLWLVKLDDDKNFEDFMGVMGAMETDPQFPDWLTFYGGVTAGPGDTTAYTIDLLPGSYTLFSFSGDDEPDFAKGMMAVLSVTEAAATGAIPPTADLQTEMVDYSYILEGTPSVGPQIVEVTNTGTEPHEIAMLKLAEESTVQDALDFMMAGEQAESAPQFEFSGGVAPMAAGLTAWYEFNFESGEYGFICFIPSPAQEGAPHFMLGMVRQISVP